MTGSGVNNQDKRSTKERAMTDLTIERRALDARPFTAYTVHCSFCGRPHEGEFGPTWYTAEAVKDIGGYGLEDDDWHFDLNGTDPVHEGYPLVCGQCWQIGWCDDCDDQIRAWQPFEEGQPGERWHLACCKTDHVHVALTLQAGQAGVSA